MVITDTIVSYPSYIPCKDKDEMKMNVIIFSDIQECSLRLDDCSEVASCVNTEGSFRCTCLQGYQGDGKECTGEASRLPT